MFDKQVIDQKLEESHISPYLGEIHHSGFFFCSFLGIPLCRDATSTITRTATSWPLSGL